MLSAVLCGANDWDGIELFGKEQELWLRQYGEFVNGIPSHDTINRVFSRINPDELSCCFSRRAKSLRKKRDNGQSGEVVAIDGKRICNSYRGQQKSLALHIVSALAVDNNICPGQIATNEKSNEITAIPQLLSMIEIEGDIVSIDAMGCQKKIAHKIRDCKADYILAVKGNQASVAESVKDTVLLTKPESEDVNVDCGHGRIETRKCFVYTELTYFENAYYWKDLTSIVKIESERIKKNTDKTEKETRYYISSIKGNAADFNSWIRSHRAIENKLHWILDVAFKEDLSRKRQDNAAENFNIVLKLVMAILDKDNSYKGSYKKKRIKAALNSGFRQSLLGF